MAQQAELQLPARREDDPDNVIEVEFRWHRRIARALEDAVDEIGRKTVCYDLGMTEQLLSKQLSGAEGKEPKARLLAYCLKHQKSGRLARLVIGDYAGYLPPQRPDLVEPEEALRGILALAMAGEFGNAGKDKVLDLYRRTKAARVTP